MAEQYKDNWDPRANHLESHIRTRESVLLLSFHREYCVKPQKKEKRFVIGNCLPKNNKQYCENITFLKQIMAALLNDSKNLENLSKKIQVQDLYLRRKTYMGLTKCINTPLDTFS